MSATNENELAAIAGSDLTVLPPAERAARVMGSSMLRIELTALAESTKDIIAMVATAFDLSILEAVERLSRIDFDAARTLAEAA
jgi:hypothetical protein